MRNSRAKIPPVRRLNETSPGDLLLVERILYDLSDGRASLPRLRAGEVVQRVQDQGMGIVVMKADGTHAYVTTLHANTVQVRPCKSWKKPARSKRRGVQRAS
jgi:hypothetical protein